MIIFGEFDQSNELKYLPNTKCFTNHTRTRFRNIFSHERLKQSLFLGAEGPPLQPVAPWCTKYYAWLEFICWFWVKNWGFERPEGFQWTIMVFWTLLSLIRTEYIQSKLLYATSCPLNLFIAYIFFQTDNFYYELSKNCPEKVQDFRWIFKWSF